MVDALGKVGVTHSFAYAAAGASVVLSIAIWAMRRGEDRANSERFGIFVGLWAPTLMAVGKVMEDREARSQG